MVHNSNYLKPFIAAVACLLSLLGCERPAPSALVNDDSLNVSATVPLPSAGKVPGTDLTQSLSVSAGGTEAVSASSATAAFLPDGWQHPLRNPAASISARFRESGCFGNTAYDAGFYHLGADVPTGTNAPVYPVSAGTVAQVSSSGWGDGNVAVIVRHPLPDGGAIFVFYGHMVSKLMAGQSVSPAQMLGTVGAYRGSYHLHVGVHSSTSLAGPFGRMPCSAWPAANDFADPFAFLLSHLPAARADLVALDAQAQADVLAAARPDWRFTTSATLTLLTDLSWDANWQLRQASLAFSGGRRVTVYHATSVWNSANRATAFFDPDRGSSFTGWRFVK